MAVGTAVVVHDPSALVFLMQWAPGHFGAGPWCLPCRYAEWGEDIRDAPAREALAETGVVVEIGDVLQVTVNRHDPDRPTVACGLPPASSTLGPNPAPATTPAP